MQTIFGTYAKKRRALEGGCKDVYIYDKIDEQLRYQLWEIWEGFFGGKWISDGSQARDNQFYVELLRRIQNELFGKNLDTVGWAGQRLNTAFMKLPKGDPSVLDFIYVTVEFMGIVERARQHHRHTDVITLAEAIAAMNTRFREHCVGYVVIPGPVAELIRVDNQHLHEEAVLPALQLLYDERFSGADAEYRRAHKHYLDGNYKECLSECLKAFESTLKTIMEKRAWTPPDKQTTAQLIKCCIENGLFPSYLDSHLTTIRCALETSVPTVRNNESAHGQGATVKDVPAHYAEYLLHQSASNIVLLVEAFKALQ